MNRESVAMCKPAISTYPQKLLAVTDYMVREGIKQHACVPDEIASSVASVHDCASYRHFVRRKLDAMENPIDVIVDEIGRLGV